jgi:putative endonuclease
MGRWCSLVFALRAIIRRMKHTLSPCHGEDHGFHPTGDHPQGGKSSMFYVYLLKSRKRNYTYIGFSADLRKRFQEHNSGLVKSTKAYVPFDLVYCEAYSDKTTARKRELELKNNSQQKEILFKKIFARVV